MGFTEHNGARKFFLLGALALAFIVSGQVTVVGTEDVSLSWFRETKIVTAVNLAQKWTLARVPAEDGLLLVIRNGVFLAEYLDYTYSAGVVSFTADQVVRDGDVLQFIYQSR